MAKFVKSVQTVNDIDFAKNMIDFCFFGRSNVGKSSLINALANQTISRTSKHPGRTQLINIFSFNDYRIIDLPGYGYANVSKDKKIQIGNMLDDYINHSLTLFAVFLVCDISVITKQDVLMNKLLREKFKYVYIVLNKIDKVNKSYFSNHKHQFIQLFSIDDQYLIPISAKTQENIKCIKNLLNKLSKKLK